MSVATLKHVNTSSMDLDKEEVATNGARERAKSESSEVTALGSALDDPVEL